MKKPSTRKRPPPFRHKDSVLIDRIGRHVLRQEWAKRGKTLTTQRLNYWLLSGVPWTHRPWLKELAEQAGVPVPKDFLTPPEFQKRPAKRATKQAAN